MSFKPVPKSPPQNFLTAVRRDHDGYVVAEEEDGIGAQRPSPRIGFCCSRSSNAKRGKAMSYVGAGSGEWVQETRYRYIGKDKGGEFNLIEPKEPLPEPELPCWCPWVPLLALCAIGMLVVGWLTLPEEDWRIPLRAARSAARALPHAQPVADPNELIMGMKVQNVDYNVLHYEGNRQLLQSFITEVKGGISVVSEGALWPENITISLSPGSVDVHAVLHPPSSVDIHHLRSKLGSSADKVAVAIQRSLGMIIGFQEITTGECRVVGLKVGFAPVGNDEASKKLEPDADSKRERGDGSEREKDGERKGGPESEARKK